MGHGAWGMGHGAWGIVILLVPLRPSASCSPTLHLISSLDDTQKNESDRANYASSKHERASFRGATLTQKGYIQNIKN
jgi:hypothetical protein